jgi:ATP-binding cassette subfamily B protein
MNYTLNNTGSSQQKGATLDALKRLIPLMKGEGTSVAIASVAILVNAIATLVAPVIISHTVDTAIKLKDYNGLAYNSFILILIFISAIIGGYVQTIMMGGVGRRVLFNLRNAIFTKLQELPVAFFNQNKTGDLISRINSDTDRLNQFFSQALLQFIRNFFLIAGAGVFLLALNPRLGAASLAPALGVLVITQLISDWVKRKNLLSLQSLGSMSAEVQESLNNFKVIVAFNRLDYFRKKFDETNAKNYTASIGAGYANNVFTPIYGLASNIAQLIVLAYGILLISRGNMTIGLLIGFMLYVTNFYTPLQQMASVWSSLQQALAALDRIAEVLGMESDVKVIPSEHVVSTSHVMEFRHVRFHYPDSADVLKGISLKLEPGKAYALVGPTGGGKTTTASLMARLYDPTEGTILLNGKDIRSFTAQERAQKIGFILQEPFLFTGSLLENIFYGNAEYAGLPKDALLAAITASGLDDLLGHFESGLDTVIQTSGDTISLGQRQLIAFLRAVMRKPELLILDEATANIDTVTEQLLQKVIAKLPKTTTKVVIAHRLNTIENADEIFFVNGGEVTAAGSLDHAVEMLMHSKRKS